MEKPETLTVMFQSMSGYAERHNMEGVTPLTRQIYPPEGGGFTQD
jgi:hypothetical protein